MENEADRIKITNEIKHKLGDSYEIKALNKKVPKIKIIGIEENILNSEEDKFIDNLIKRNGLKHLKTIRKTIKIVKNIV